MKACEMLYAAAVENIDCFYYIDQRVVKQLVFKAQQLSSLVRETDPELQKAARQSLMKLVDRVASVKSSSTEDAAQIYSAIQETECPELIARSKKLL
jgi:hypothetical protein